MAEKLVPLETAKEVVESAASFQRAIGSAQIVLAHGRGIDNHEEMSRTAIDIIVAGERLTEAIDNAEEALLKVAE